MKFDEHNAADLPRQVPQVCVFLLYGEDPVHIARRARVLLDVLASSRGTPFPSADLQGGDHVRIAEELNSPMLGEGNRLVRLRSATEAAAASLEAILQSNTAGTLVAEAGALTPRSRLRSVVEQSRRGAAMQCRAATSREIGSDIERVLAGYGLRIDPAARELLLQKVAASPSVQLQAEKLALLAAGSARAVSVSDVLDLDDGREAAIDDLTAAVALGRTDEADRLTEALLDGGSDPVSLVRGLLGHMARLRAVRAAIESGASVDAALSDMRPPAFRRNSEIRDAVRFWRLSELDGCCAALWRADLACRQTGMPTAALCRETIRDVAQAAYCARKEPTPPSGR